MWKTCSMNPLNQKMTMKTRKLLWAALSMTAALMMTACSSSDDNDTTEAPVAPSTATASKTIPYTVTVGGDEATTRANVDGNYKTLRFAEGDKLYITGENIQGELDLKDGDAGKTSGATFSGDLEYTGGGNPPDELELTATLVSAQQEGTSKISVDATTGAVTVNYPTSAYCSSVNDAVQQYSRLTATSTYGEHAFTLAQQTAFLNFEITFEDGTATGTSLSAVVSNGGSAVCTANVTTATESGMVVAKFVLPVAAGTTTLSSATVTMGGKAPIAFGASQTLTGKVYNVKKTQNPATDLSMVDCVGNARASRWTANCYMVHTAGNYKLPLVYGNAIKAGEDNTVAYNPGEKESDYPYCANFVNHAGEAITAPWIKDNGIAVTQAELLWQDAQGLITAVGIDGDYLTLTVGKDATTQEGNALIAAKDASGTIVWSWQIWVTKQTFAAATLTAVDTGSHTYSVTPVNLGWVGDATSATGYQTYYQWGRKDAFFPGTGTGNTNHTVYDINGAEVTEGLTYVTSNPTVTIADNIKNPTTFYRVGEKVGKQETDKPSTAEYYNLWDAQQTSNVNNIATATVKTVYDPSPAGFCVPTGNLYNYMFDTKVVFTWDDANKGRNLPSSTSNVFFPASGYRALFPASGYRARGSGLIGNVGSWGYYWSASACYGYSGHYFNFTSSTRDWHNSYRANGFSVRAVAEE